MNRPDKLPSLFHRLRLPLFGAPMFIVSTPALVIAQCRAGIIGSIPALNARPAEMLDDWLAELNESLGPDDAPYAINLIVHRTNPQLDRQLALCEKHKVPIVISSLGAREEVNVAAHGWGAIVFHDIIHDRFARKAIEKGADGLIAVAAGAGGHAGTVSPFALVQEIRAWFDGPLALSGCIATGGAILAAQAMGADFAYAGSPFIATHEANAPDAYKQMIVNCASQDILYSDAFTGVLGNYLRPSIVAAGLDPDNLPSRESGLDTASDLGETKAWRDVWGAGQGIGAIDKVQPAADLIARLAKEYRAAKAALCG